MTIPVSHIRQRLQLCSQIFDETETFNIPSQLIMGITSRYPRNDQFELVYEKTVLINTLYSTVVYDTLAMAKHIVSINVDVKLKGADISVVADIRAGHGIRARQLSRKEFDFYSFSTKYAAFHRPDIYPLFDSYVMKLLSSLNRSHMFMEKFSQQEMRDYSKFKRIVDEFSMFVDMESFRYEKFDHALWLYGKYIYNPTTLDATIRRRIEQGS